MEDGRTGLGQRLFSFSFCFPRMPFCYPLCLLSCAGACFGVFPRFVSPSPVIYEYGVVVTRGLGSDRGDLDRDGERPGWWKLALNAVSTLDA